MQLNFKIIFVYIPLFILSVFLIPNCRSLIGPVLDTAVPLYTGDHPWQEIKAEPGSLKLNIRGKGERTIEFQPSCSAKPGTESSDFKFFVKKGNTDKLLVLFSGGGACWSGQNCSPGDGSSGLRLDGRTSYVDEIYKHMNGVLHFTSAGEYGMLDHDDEENPIRDWNAVWIFSCDGSVFWGSNDQEYTDPFYGGKTATIRHRGFDNAMAVLAYLQKNFPDQKQILVSGQSAGGYGSAMLFPYFREAYPEARADLLVDSSAGIVPRKAMGDSYEFMEVAAELWAVEKQIPEWIGLPADNNKFSKMDFRELLTANAKYYKDSNIAEYSPAWDLGQVYFWHIMNTYTDPEADWLATIYRDKRLEAIKDNTWCEWNQRLVSTRKELLNKHKKSGISNYSFYLAPGMHHGIGQDFDGESDGIRFKAWLTEVVTGEKVPESVFCKDCQKPEHVSCDSKP